MEFLINAFNVILYQPLFNALVLLYEYLPGHDFGLTVIALTVIVRLLFYPLMVQSIKSQKSLSELQPKIQEIQSKYKEDKEKQARATMELYQKEKINPFGGCLPLLIQLPILIALYRVFWKGFQPEAMDMLYSFVPHPGTIDPTFLGIINLGEASLILAVLAGIAQFFQTKMITPKTPKSKEGGSQMAQFSGMMQKQMLYFFPIFTVFILWKLPAAIGLYWIITALFSILQQYLTFKKPKYEPAKP
jgi:YidC/Oxa1 family membrane protein insertase